MFMLGRNNIKIRGLRQWAFAITVALASGALSGTSPPANAADSCELQKIAAPSILEGGFFGLRIAADHDVMLVGAVWDDNGCTNDPGCESVFVYRTEGIEWVLEATLSAPDGNLGDDFGRVAIRQDVIVVGAPMDLVHGVGTSGSAYVYRFDGQEWVFEMKLVASDAADGDLFGLSVAVYGDVIVVGAFDAQTPGPGTGAAYVFRFTDTTWIEEAKLVGWEGEPPGTFGHPVGIDGDTIVVGAENDGEAGGGWGVAYAHRYDGTSWMPDTKLVAADAEPNDGFGFALSVRDGNVLIGAWKANNPLENAGAAYIFHRADNATPDDPSDDIWIEQAKLTPMDPTEWKFFGTFVAVEGEHALVGARGDQEQGTSSGAGYVFTRDDNGTPDDPFDDSWPQTAKLTASDAQVGDSLSTSALSGSFALLGAYGDEDGSVYSFAIAGDCDDDGAIDVCQIFEGTTIDCNNNGVPDDCDLANGDSVDKDGNGMPDECVCAGDDDPICNDGNPCTAATCVGSACWNTPLAENTPCSDGVFCNGLELCDAFGVCQSADPACDVQVVCDETKDVCVELDDLSCEITKLSGVGEMAGDALGTAVAIDGDWLVLGAPTADTDGVETGAIYIFERNGTDLVLETVVTASNAAAGDRFGMSVAVEGDTIVVGATGRDAAGMDSGTAYVFRREGANWVEEAELVPADAAADDGFGTSISIDADRVIVGSPRNDDPEIDAGAAYIFQRDGTTWTLEAKLTPLEGAESDFFGTSVTIEAPRAIIGATGYDIFEDDSGTIYLYTLDPVGTPDDESDDVWIENGRIIFTDPNGGEMMGTAVSIDGAHFVLCAAGAALYCTDPAVPCYPGLCATWRYVDPDTPDDPTDDQLHYEAEFLAGDAAGAGFGTSADLRGQVLVIGAVDYQDPAVSTGAAYAFRLDDGTPEIPHDDAWVLDAKLVGAEATGGDMVGFSVATDGQWAVVGAPGDDDACPVDPDCDSGSALVFAVAGDCNDNDAVDTCEILDDPDMDQNGDGVLDECEPLFILWNDPPDGAIDARQTSEPDGSNPAGWDTIEIAFNVDATSLTLDDFTITQDPPGNPPTIASLTVESNIATLELSDFISPGAWTIFTHNESATSARIGYLPADVNNDRLSNANDVLYLIDVLNGVIDPMPPSYQTDTDRSGATNANDVLRVIDLLNGAGVYDEYLDAKLPA